MRCQSPVAPAYWRNETSGALRRAVRAYLEGELLSSDDIVLLRAYLRQWIGSDVWRGDAVAALRLRVDSLCDRATLAAWLADADDAGVDPL